MSHRAALFSPVVVDGIYCGGFIYSLYSMPQKGISIAAGLWSIAIAMSNVVKTPIMRWFL